MIDRVGRRLRPRGWLARRLPKAVRQHWKLLVATVAVTATVVVVFGEVRIRPYITGETTVLGPAITENIAGTVDLFDASVPHTLSIELTDAEYRDMVHQYVADGDKKWANAEVTIDGTTMRDVAVRLKGNSTLMALRGDRFGPPPDGWSGPPSMGFLEPVSADDPTSLPLLISFNENVDGRGYQGMTELALRPGTSVLNEAMALSMTALTRQPSQRYGYATYAINGDTTTRLVLEHPDATYANRLFGSDGYLYKARARSKLEYRGPDQSTYAQEFKQINAADTGNLQPLINFVRWLDTADDEEFARSLADWVDVESFARYVATQNLLVNPDDMAGPGQNYYLWYDLGTQRFSVLSWDLNLAMVMGEPNLGPHDPLEMKLPSGRKPPSGREFPPGSPPWRDGNTLKERFLASTTFNDLYIATYWDLYEQMYADGRALELLDAVIATVPVPDDAAQQELDSSAATLRSWLQKRTDALAQLRTGEPA
ncbi:CotH kinase family protein [Mycolicibacterium thermoresistibile]